MCHGKETVRCLLCHKELVVKLNRKLVDGKEVPVLVSSEIGQYFLLGDSLMSRANPLQRMPW